MGRVEGKVAIVTGGARGMGAADAALLIAEGASVIITDVLADEGEALAEQLGSRCRFLPHDVSLAADWERVVADAEAAFGTVSVLVNNAGISFMGSLESQSEEKFRRVFEVNQLSVFLGMKAVLPSMRRAGGGSIVNISSIAGLIGVPGAIGYSASKWAVTGMTKVAALELASSGIRVNSIHPGSIRTPMTSRATEDFVSGLPMPRFGEPQEVAQMVLFLASDESSYCTGGQYAVDGGWSIAG